MNVHEFHTISLPEDSVHFSNLKPDSDYTIAVSSKQEQMPCSFLAFKTLRTQFNKPCELKKETHRLKRNLDDGLSASDDDDDDEHIAPILRQAVNFTSFSNLSDGVEMVPLNFAATNISNTTISVHWEPPLATNVQVSNITDILLIKALYKLNCVSIQDVIAEIIVLIISSQEHIHNLLPFVQFVN